MKKLLLASVSVLLSSTAFAADAPAPLAFPAVGNTLKANPKPLAVNAGPVGKVNVGGVLSGLAFT